MERTQMILKMYDNDKEVQITIHRDSDIFELMGEIRGLLIAWGYHQDSVLEGCEYILEEYKDNE